MPTLQNDDTGYAQRLEPFVVGKVNDSDTSNGSYVGALAPFLSKMGDKALSYLRWNLIGSPGFTPGEIALGTAKAAADAGRIMTTPPMQPPVGSSTDDSGRIGFARGGQFVPLQDVDPQAARAYYGDQTARRNIAPRTALALIGSGAGFAEKGAAGAAGAKLLQPADVSSTTARGAAVARGRASGANG